MKDPKEIAQQLVQNFYACNAEPWFYAPLIKEIAAAIQARDEEREPFLCPNFCECETRLNAVLKLETELDALKEREKEHQEALHDLKCTIKELRSINVEDGISLGKAYDWRAERDALREQEKAHQDELCKRQDLAIHWMKEFDKRQADLWALNVERDALRKQLMSQNNYAT